MLTFIRRLLSGRESGQAMLFFFGVATVLTLILGVAVEGGRLFVTYKQMQAAADMAALVGAQKLPDDQATAKSDACTNAQQNGFGDGVCTATGTPPADSSYVIPSTPPVSQSPYSPALTYDDYYIEVQVTYNLGTIPIFQVPITLSAHAIARNGIEGPQDYALVALDPLALNNTPGINFNGTNPLVVVGSAISNQTGTNSITPPGGSTVESTCNGEWFTASNEQDPAGSHFGAYTNNDSAYRPSYAPPHCDPTTFDNSTLDTTAAGAWVPGYGKVGDSYTDTDCPDGNGTTSSLRADCPQSTPPKANMSTTINNCAECNSLGYYYDRTANQWGVVSSATNKAFSPKNGDSVELFPGIYPGGISIGANGTQVFFNPGVYTLGGTSNSAGLGDNGGTVCVFGAPICDVVTGVYNIPNGNTKNYLPGKAFDCGGASFKVGDANYISGDTWYYYCSPWGIWDGSVHPGSSAVDASGTTTCTSTAPAGCRPAGLPTTAPEYYDASTSTITSVPMNGVSFYIQSGNVNIGGGAGMSLAFPNPCAGTGTGNAGTPSASFPKGAYNFAYTYPAGSLPYIDNGNSSPSLTASQMIYPNADLMDTCQDSSSNKINYLVWKYEFGKTPPPGQHLHFLFFAKNHSTSITLAGGGTQLWWGVLHTFPFASTNTPSALIPSTYCTACTVSLTGSSGTNGPAMLFGQIIADNEKFSGSASVQVFDRPTGKPQAPGTELIQ